MSRRRWSSVHASAIRSPTGRFKPSDGHALSRYMKPEVCTGLLCRAGDERKEAALAQASTVLASPSKILKRPRPKRLIGFKGVTLQLYPNL